MGAGNPQAGSMSITNPQSKSVKDLLTFTGTADRSTLLPPGEYLLFSNVLCYYLQGDVTVTATEVDTHSLWLPAYHERYISVTGPDDGYVSAVATAGGDMQIAPQ